MKIPFNWLPASWGLKGKKFKEAEAYYLYTGEELERKLLNIEYDNAPPKAKTLELDKKFGHISDYDYDVAIMEIDADELLPATLQANRLTIDHRHGKIDDYDYEMGMAIASLSYDETALGIKKLDIDYRYHKIEKLEHDKGVATLNKEPWIDVKDHGFNPNEAINGLFFEFDWNSYWIEMLRSAGYNGASEEEMVEQWFTDICNSHVQEVLKATD